MFDLMFAFDSSDVWDLVGKDVTNNDGRAKKLLEPSPVVQAGIYKISFDTRAYEKDVLMGANGFYPHASIVFEILESQVRS